MFRKSIQLLMLWLCVSCLCAPAAYACACCADRGSYSISVRKPDDYLLEEMKKMVFGSKATLFTTEAGLSPDVIRGLPADYNDENSAFSEDFGFAGWFAANQWKFTFRDYQKRSGVLMLTRPPTVLRFAVDTHENDSADHVTLYKEWRFQGDAKGSGFFQTGMTSDTKFFLVFQGRGNGCDNAADFTHWRVEITGSKARYAFWGKFEQ